MGNFFTHSCARLVSPDSILYNWKHQIGTSHRNLPDMTVERRCNGLKNFSKGLRGGKEKDLVQEKQPKRGDWRNQHCGAD